VAVGVNLTLILQLDPAVSDEPHVVVSEKSPLTAMLVIFRAAVPVFFNVPLCDALVVPTTCAANVKLVVDRLTMGTVPVPFRLTMCGLPAASSVIVTAPVRIPVAVGVNLTLILQLDPAVSDEPHVVVSEKSPLTAMLVIFSAAVPVFFNVTLCDALVVPTLREPKLKLVGERLTTGAVPVPVRLTI